MPINTTFSNTINYLSENVLLQHPLPKDASFSLPPQPEPENLNDNRSIFQDLFPNVSFFASISYNKAHTIGSPSTNYPDLLSNASGHDMELLYNFMQAKLENGFQSFFSIWIAFDL